MSFTVLVYICVFFFLYHNVLRTVILWFGARAEKVEHVTLFRAFLTSLALFVVWSALLAAFYAVGYGLAYGEVGFRTILGVCVLEIGLWLVATWLCIKFCLRTSGKHAACVGLFMLGLSIPVEFGMAFLVKWTVCEAFVVPTGALAPTVYGAHEEVTCANCRFHYAVSLSGRTPQRHFDRFPDISAPCPNCGEPHIIPDDGVPILDGDRILVDKVTAPNRWDLIVFKYPNEPTVNYVKRLVGLPGETLELCDGDVFIDAQRLAKAPGTVGDLWFFEHDTSYVPTSPIPGAPRWKSSGDDSAWQELPNGGWKCTDATRGDVLVFSGTITDRLAYNGETAPLAYQQSFESVTAFNGDVRIACTLEAFSGGTLEFRWELANHTAAATIGAAGDVKIETASGNEAVNRSMAKLPEALPGSTIAFAVRDGQAYVLQNDVLVASEALKPNDLEAAREQPTPTESCKLQIVARECSATLSHITLSKDVYYADLDARERASFRDTSLPSGCTGDPITIPAGAYYTLGDNSRKSLDSRFWGTVSRGAILGVARWCYWPVRRWHTYD